jgi:hypothetical protein
MAAAPMVSSSSAAAQQQRQQHQLLHSQYGQQQGLSAQQMQYFAAPFSGQNRVHQLMMPGGGMQLIQQPPGADYGMYVASLLSLTLLCLLLSLLVVV